MSRCYMVLPVEMEKTDCSMTPSTLLPRSFTSRCILRASIKSESHCTNTCLTVSHQPTTCQVTGTLRSYNDRSSGSCKAIIPSAEDVILLQHPWREVDRSLTYDDSRTIQILDLIQPLVFGERINGDIGLSAPLQVGKTLEGISASLSHVNEPYAQLQTWACRWHLDGQGPSDWHGRARLLLGYVACKSCPEPWNTVSFLSTA